jgi:hypothetical protein
MWDIETLSALNAKAVEVSVRRKREPYLNPLAVQPPLEERHYEMAEEDRVATARMARHTEV